MSDDNNNNNIIKQNVVKTNICYRCGGIANTLTGCFNKDLEKCVSLLLTGNIIKADVEFKVYDESDLTKYPSSTNGNSCSYQFLLWVIVTNNEVIQTLNISNSLQTKNSTHYLYTILVSDLPYSQGYPIGLSAQDSDFNYYQYTFYLNCNLLDISKVDFQVIGNKVFNDPLLGYYLLLNTTGIPLYTVLTMKIGENSLYYTFGGYDTFRMLNAPYYVFSLNSKISGPIDVSLFVYPDYVKNITIQNFFDDYSDNYVVNYYPSQVENQITTIGQKLYPYYTVQAKTPSKKDPLFTMYYLNTPIQSQLSPISEKDGITTYFSSFYLGIPSGQFSLYAQNHTSRIKLFEKTINVIDVPMTKYYDSDVTLNTVEDDDLFFNIGISSQESYNLNPIQFGQGTITRIAKAPFGFTHSGTSGNNTNYGIHFSVPVTSYNKNLPFQIFDSQVISYEIVGNNNPNPSNPVFTSYEFIYLANSKYILKINIVSSECGVAFIAFNSVDVKRISQYRVSGDSFNGVYEIPIDFDLDLSFNFIAIHDLCGRFTQIEDGILIPNLPFQRLFVPFLNYNKFLIFNIKDVSFLFNNLDVRRQSIGNTMYFNVEGADIKTPFSFRLPIMDSVSTSGFFTHEFFAKWNSSINKFQVDFVVPKNSRAGRFAYSITNGLLNYVPSDFLPDNYQLIISKSNFDPLGPAISKVEKIPFGGGKFGWHLTISDPINGFDNGTITVTGSDDNSIYKFNLFPKDRISGDVNEGVYEIIIKTTPLLCVNQDYIITFVKLWDTGAQYSVFDYTTENQYSSPNQMINPFLSFIGDSTINRYSISCNKTQDLSGPSLSKLIASTETIDVSSVDRTISFTLEVQDTNIGINIYGQGPIVYLIAEGFDIVECVSVLLNYTSDTFESAYYQCFVEVPVGFAQNLGVFSLGVYGIRNNFGIYNGYSTDMLLSLSLPHKVLVTYTSNQPLLLETGKASSKGGEYFVFGRNLDQTEKLTIIDSISNEVKNYTVSSSQKYGLSSVVSISDLAPIRNDFYVFVTSKSGITSNRLLVSPVLFNDYIPEEPLPTNAPQQCLGNPVCGGITHGTCNNQTGCVCIYPWKGKSCQDQIIEPEKPPIVDPNQPSTGIDIPDDKDEDGNPVTNIHYKSLISLYSLREIDINGKTVNNYPFNNKWTFIQVTDLKSYYQINITTGNNFNTTVSATLEWFNQSKTITFADQDLEMSANSIKYNIEISKYPFSSKLNYLQLVMSATLTSTSTDSCSSKDFGETTSGDNSNYINIQIDNKSLYGRFIKRGIIDDNKVVSLSNEILDSTLNAISKPSQTQTYIGITIQYYEERLFIDPDFSVLLSSNSASSNSNSICKSKGLSGSKIAGIVIGATAFAAVIGISIVYYFKKKKDSEKLKQSISNKLSQMNNTTTA